MFRDLSAAKLIAALGSRNRRSLEWAHKSQANPRRIQMMRWLGEGCTSKCWFKRAQIGVGATLEMLCQR